MSFTEEELVAIFCECNCCSDYKAWSKVTKKVHSKLKQIGHFKREGV